MSNLPTTKSGKAVSVSKGGVDKKLAAFLAKGTGKAVVAATAAKDERPRIVFAMDATASRGPSWDRAKKVQGAMFAAMSGKGAIQLASFGGNGFKASRWADDANELAEDMAAVRCVAGNTQIGSLLAHVEAEAAKYPVRGVILIEDTMEENEDALVHQAARLKLLGVPVFVFHEVGNERAEPALRRIAEASGGAYGRFDEGPQSQANMQTLLGAVGAYATGGKAALLRYGEQRGSAAVKAIAAQLKIEGPKG